MDWRLLIIVLAAAGLHAAWNFAARKARGDVVVIWLSVGLAALLSLPFAAALALSEEALLRSVPFILATGIVHAFYFGLLAHAYEVGEISTVYPVARGTGVAGTPVIAYWLIGEEISLTGGIAVIAVVLGIALLAAGQLRGHKTSRPFVAALLVGATIIAYSVIDKAAVARINPVVYIWCMFALSALFLTPYVLLRHPTALGAALKHRKRYVFLIGPVAMATYLVILFAFQLGKVSYIVAAREFSVVIGAVLGFALLGESLTVKKGLGIAAVTAGVFIMKMA